jgi:hypothetical protein
MMEDAARAPDPVHTITISTDEVTPWGDTHLRQHSYG